MLLVQNNYVVSLVFLSYQLELIWSVDYCKLSCNEDGNRVEHTMCPPCHHTEGCIPIRDKSDDFRMWILGVHNEIRNIVALGRVSSLPDISVSNMKLLSYDLHLERVAECYINRCWDIHDNCRKTKKFRDVGQNYIIYNDKDLNKKYNIEMLVRNLWFLDELKHLSMASTVGYVDDERTRNVSQLLWAETSNLGCARTLQTPRYHRTGNFTNYRLVCNYGPSGNEANQKMFQIGKPGSECANNLTNFEYKGLCGNYTFRLGMANSFGPQPFSLFVLSSLLISILLLVVF